MISVAICRLAVALLAALPACAQYPGQVAKASKDAPEMRAVAVLEWTGEEDHPKASRLVPVSLYDGQELQDAGIYLARPAATGPSQRGGVRAEAERQDRGPVRHQRRRPGAGLVGWIRRVEAAAQAQARRAGGRTCERRILGRDAPERPPDPAPQAHAGDAPSLGNRHEWSASSGSSGSAAQPPDPDRPTLHKKDSSTATSQPPASQSLVLHERHPARSRVRAPRTDPDRPTLHKKTSDGDSASGSAGEPAIPTGQRSRRRASKKQPEDVGYVESLPDVTDPDRPRLQRGKVNGRGPRVLPTLMGLPPDMHQAVAVSDAKSRPEHLWGYSWANPDDEAKMKAEMEDMARKALGLTPPPSAARAQANATATPAESKAAPAPPPPPRPLLDEQFRVFELAYGSGATMVLSAHTDGPGAQQKFVTLVAQPDLYGNVLVLLKNVTDAAHLDDNAAHAAGRCRGRNGRQPRRAALRVARRHPAPVRALPRAARPGGQAVCERPGDLRHRAASTHCRLNRSGRVRAEAFHPLNVSNSAHIFQETLLAFMKSARGHPAVAVQNALLYNENMGGHRCHSARFFPKHGIVVTVSSPETTADVSSSSIPAARDACVLAAHAVPARQEIRMGRAATVGEGVNWLTSRSSSSFTLGALAALFLFSWQRLLVMAVLYVLAINVGIGMCYHRLLTHRGYHVPKWLEYVMSIFATTVA